MHILCITHADFETPGVIETWAHDKGYGFTICRPYLGECYASDKPFDSLIVMGGPQSPLAMETFPYLRDEIALIKAAIEDGKPVLGFCLGAQLIGEALGATTARSPEKEVGVFPITLTEAGKKDPLFHDFPSTFPVIHWHNDMPGLTETSRILAFSEGCPRQVVRYKDYVYGFQCHLEITQEGIDTMIEACPGDLAASRFTQTTEALRIQDYVAINRHMECILDRLIVAKPAIDHVRQWHFPIG